MKILLAHVKNPNFLLRCGRFKGKTLLQGAIATDQKDLIQMLLSNTHGSKISKLKEPIIIDVESAKWIERNVLPTGERVHQIS